MQLFALMVSVGLCSLGLAAQVSPGHFGLVDGNAGTRSPLAAGVTSRTLQVHGDVARSRQPIRGLAFRRDSNNRATFSPFTVTLTVAMSTGSTSVAAPSATFAANHGADLVTVFARRAVSFAANAPSNSLPASFDFVIPFDQNFNYSLFGPSAPVVWDMTVEQPSLGAERPLFDFVRLDSSAANPPPVGFEFGSGCIATGRTSPMRPRFASTALWHLNAMAVQLGGSDGPANAAAVGVLGFSNTTFGGLPLPLLLPGSQTAPSGPCTVYCDVVLDVPGVLDAGGGANLPVQTAIAPELHGLTFFHQLWAFDPPANPMGLVTSAASVRQIVAPFTAVEVSRVEALGQTGPSGLITLNSGVVTRFVR